MGAVDQGTDNRPIRMLVVDDEPDLQTLIRQKFRKQIRENRYEFLFASDGAEALAVLEKQRDVELVLTDINMPRMDGLTLLSKLRDLDHPVLKAVIVSAYGDLQNIRKAMNERAFDFLTKPIDFRDLDTTINKTLEELGLLKESLRVQSEWSSLQHELEVARKIQQGIVPCKFPAFPDRGDIDVYGQMIPARQVGGDFFDFFLLDANHLGFVIGDVSGKGVPAAIFMAVSRGLLKAVASQGLSPGKCLDEVNRMLCSDNEEGMFVTVFYAVLNTETGTLEFSSAGHHAPYLLRPSAQCGELEIDTGLVLGVLKSTQYQTQSTRLVGGDRLFLFTDGVTEAMNAQEDFYGDERLAGTLAGLQELALDELVDGVVHSVRAFSHDTTQSDDITAMAVSYQQP